MTAKTEVISSMAILFATWQQKKFSSSLQILLWSRPRNLTRMEKRYLMKMKQSQRIQKKLQRNMHLNSNLTSTQTRLFYSVERMKSWDSALLVSNPKTIRNGIQRTWNAASKLLRRKMTFLYSRRQITTQCLVILRLKYISYPCSVSSRRTRQKFSK